MKFIALATLVGISLVPHMLSAQPEPEAVASVRPERGRIYEFRNNTTSLSKTVTGMYDMEIKGLVNSSISLQSDSVGADRSSWKGSYHTISTSMRDDTELPSMEEGRRVAFATVRNGTLADFDFQSTAVGEEKKLPNLMGGLFSAREMIADLFLRSEWREKKPGDSWTETRVDTMVTEMKQFEDTIMTLVQIVTSNITYHYEGTIDTLQTKAAKITWSTTEFSVNGKASTKFSRTTTSRTFDVWRQQTVERFNGVRTDEYEHVMNGSGTRSGTAYYALNDGMLSAASSVTDIDIEVEQQGMFNVSLTTRVHMDAETLRK